MGLRKNITFNMILQDIHNYEDKLKPSERTIVIHFEPWNFSSTDQLLSQFFIRLINEFNSTSDEKLIQIATAIEKYSFLYMRLNERKVRSWLKKEKHLG